MPRGEKYPLRMSFALSREMKIAIRDAAERADESDGDLTREAIRRELARRNRSKKRDVGSSSRSQ